MFSSYASGSTIKTEATDGELCPKHFGLVYKALCSLASVYFSNFIFSYIWSHMWTCHETMDLESTGLETGIPRSQRKSASMPGNGHSTFGLHCASSARPQTVRAGYPSIYRLVQTAWSPHGSGWQEQMSRSVPAVDGTAQSRWGQIANFAVRFPPLCHLSLPARHSISRLCRHEASLGLVSSFQESLVQSRMGLSPAPQHASSTVLRE